MPQWIEMTRSPEYSPKLIGQELVFLQNDFRELLSDLGDVAFMDKIEKAMLGETIIIGGYLNTQLIAAKSIFAEHLDVESLSAISANLGTITSGSLNIGNGAFKVSSAGKLEATGADISGSVTANSGAIGGWQLTSSLIQYRPNSSNNNSRFYLNSDPTGTYRIASYNSSGTRQFSVTSDGVLYARNADISGTITSSAVTVTGGTITGTTIRTSAGSSRIQLTSNALESYLNNVRRVRLDYDSLDFYNSQNIHIGSLLGSYFDDNHKMIIHSSRGAEMVASTEFVAGSNENPDNGARIVVYSDYDGFAPSVNMEAGTNRSTNFASISVGDNGYGMFIGKGFSCFGDWEVFGDKSAVVETESYGYRKLYALETPDCRFVTYMEMELETGEHYIEIEPMFRETIGDYFVVPHIQNNADVSILEREKDGFTVLVEKKRAEVVFEVNGVRKGYEGVYMEEVKHDLKGRMSKHEN